MPIAQCEDGHERICWDDGACPVCETKAELAKVCSDREVKRVRALEAVVEATKAFVARASDADSCVNPLVAQIYRTLAALAAIDEPDRR